jgi:hypothetical protein
MKYLATYILIFFFSWGFAQSSVTVKAGSAIPYGDFVNKNPANYDAARAGLGLNLGVSYQYRLFNSGLSLLAGLELFHNPVSDEFKQETRNDYNNTFGNNYEITFQRYITIPLSAGLEYRLNADGKFALYAQGRLSANYFKITDLDIVAIGQSLNYSAEPATSLGLQLGLGIGINQKLDIGFSLYNLGEYMVDIEFKSLLGVVNDTNKYKVDIGVLYIGYRF